MTEATQPPAAADTRLLPSPVPPIEEGDAAARSGDWPTAIDVWRQHLDRPSRDEAASRIRWFLAEAGASTAAPRGAPGWRLLLVSLVCGLAGTALVLVGENYTGTTRNVLAALAWVLYIASATLAVTWAFRAGRTSRPTRLTEDEVHDAISLAAALEGRRETSL